MPKRFWLEVALFIAATAVVSSTLLGPNWIETVLGLDPDRGSGFFEWLIAGGPAVVALAFAVATLSVAVARAERRRTRATAKARAVAVKAI